MTRQTLPGVLPGVLAVGAAMLLAVPLAAGPARAADLTVMSGGAVKAGLSDVLPGYEKSAGKAIAVEYVPMGPLLKRLGEGAKPDVVVLTAEALAEAEKKGWIAAGTSVEVGRVGVGVAVHESAAAPDISTPEAFKRTLLAAKSIVHINPATGTSGKHLAEVFDRLGIAAEMKAKAKLLEGGYVVEPVGRGEIEIGLHQITEILPVKGIKLVGPLPPALQKVTIYVGAVTTAAAKPDEARKMLAFLRTPEVRAAFAKKGFMAGE